MGEKLRMYILTGISCAGKSTLGRAIAETTKAEIIELNAILKEMGIGLQGEHIPEEQYILFHREAERIAKEKLLAGISIVYDVTPFTREKREQLKRLAIECKADTLLVYVNTPFDLALQRWESTRESPDRFININFDNFRYVAEHFEPPIDEPHIVFQAGDIVSEWINRHLISSK